MSSERNLASHARRVAVTSALAVLLAATNAAELVPFDPADRGQLFGVRSEILTAGAPSGVTFINGVLYVADSETGVVIAHHADGTETTLLAGQAADESSPVFGLVPNMLASAPVRMFTNNTQVDTTALLISDSSVSRVLAIGVEGAFEGEHLFTMELDWPDGQEDIGHQVAVINGMAMAPGSRFEFTPQSATLDLVGALAAGWTFDFGRHHPGAALVYTTSTNFVYDAADARFEAPPAHVLDANGTAKEVFGVTFDSLGNLYVVDTITEILSVYAPDFSLLFTFGTPSSGAEFHEPYGVAYWPDAGGTSGRLFIADALNNSIKVFRPILDTLTLDHLFTIEGFTIELFDSALPYALAIDPATGRLATSDSSGIANRSWILQTRNLVAFDFEVVGVDDTPIDSVCSGAAYQVHFSLTVPEGWPPLSGVEPVLSAGGVTQAAPDGPVDLSPGEVYRYHYSLTAPVDLGDLILVAGGYSVDTTDVLTRKGLVAVSSCSPTNPPPTVTAANSGPSQLSGWIPAFHHPTFQVTLIAADDVQVTDTEYEVLGANDIGFGVIRVANPIQSNAQTVTIELPVYGETTIKFRARDNELEWSDMQEHVVNLVFIENRADFEGAVIAPFTAGPPASSGIIYSAAPLPPGIAFNPVTAEFSGTLGHDAAGTHTVVVTETSAVNPANNSSFSFQWTVFNVNVLPVAIADAVSTSEDTALVVAAPGVLSNDSDPDLGALTAILLNEPVHGTLAFNANGSFAYSPFGNFNGTDNFVYKAYDGADSTAPVVVTITVNPVNDAPSFVAGASQSVLEDSGPVTTAWAAAVSAGPADEAAQTLMFIVTNSNPGLFSAQPAISAAGVLGYQPAPNASGSAVVTVRLRDDGGTANGGVDTSDPQMFTIIVTPVDDPPAAQNDSYSFAGGLLAVPAPGVLANDSDVDSATLTASLAAAPSNGVLQVNPDGSFTFTAPAGFDGAVTFTYHVTDGVSTSLATVTITVTGNQPPICTAASSSVDLWPPNHKQIYVAVGGLVDPEESPIEVTFTSIVQDEPTDSTGQGHTSQDGGIENNGARAWVRAERSGTRKVPGDGRVYLIGFTATDAAGLSCTGTVRVDVPHDQRGIGAVLSPGRWNSITGQRVQ